MPNSFLLAIRFLILLFSGHKQVALENIALRHQLAAYTREKKLRRLRDRDRLFWIALKNLWEDWRSALEFVQPETVIGWQRKRFKRYWWRLSQTKRSGRPRVYLEIRRLVRTMAAANPIWGAPRIHGELLKLGFEVSVLFRD
jgi:putative transposase